MAQSPSPLADYAVALIVGLAAGVIVHVAQNARVLVKRIPQEIWQWNKDNEEDIGLIFAALCVLYSVPRLWFFFRQNRRIGQAPEEDLQQQQQQTHEPPLECLNAAIDSLVPCSASHQAHSSAMDRSDSLPQEAVAAFASSTAKSQCPPAIASCVSRGALSGTNSPRSFSDVNDFIKSPTMTSNGLAAPSAGVPLAYAYTPLEPPPAQSVNIVSYYSGLPASDVSPRARRQHPLVMPHVPPQLQQLNRPTSLQSLPSHLLETIIRHLPLHSRCILARTSSSLNTAVLNAPAHVWHRSAVHISIVEGLPGSALESVDLSGKHAPFVPSIFSSQFVRRSRELEPHCAETADRPLRRHSEALCAAELEN